MSEEIANVDMARAWDGEEGDQWTQFADEYDNTNRSIWARFLETDPIGRADQVLDIGCGCGQSTRDAARLAHEGSALGVDLSSSMLAVARRRATAEGVTNVDFCQADAQVYAFDPGTFDICDQPVRRDVLREPDGRLHQHCCGPSTGWTPGRAGLAGRQEE